MVSQGKKERTEKAYFILIDTSAQKLYVFYSNKKIREYPVSTSKYGVGSRQGSHRTPLGRHRVMSKIGKHAHLRTIFTHRRNTKRIAKKGGKGPADCITTRILRLEGLEPGKNRGKGIDSRDRYIYIHGTMEEHLIGTPASHGCVRMKNKDVVDLFNLIPRGTLVNIV